MPTESTDAKGQGDGRGNGEEHAGGLRILVVEDDFTSRKILCALLRDVGHCDVAVDGEEAIHAFQEALESGDPYDLICLDIMMPKLDGHQALKAIRALEESKKILVGDGVRVIMTTALSDKKTVMEAFREQCEAYLVKPIIRDNLMGQLRELELI